MADEYELVMPFVTVASKGGPHDDQAYVAGYEMGLLAADLQYAPGEFERTIRAENLPQADLIAMHHGATMERLPMEDGAPEEWVFVRFKPTVHNDTP